MRSRRGTALTVAFSDIAAAAQRDLPDGGVLLDGELVIWHEGRLAFDRLQRRMNRTAASVAGEIRAAPAHFVAFDVLHLAGENLMPQQYLRRRERLERLFAEEALGPPWTLCPMTLDRAEAERWMQEWAQADVGLEGIAAKKLNQPYRPGTLHLESKALQSLRLACLLCGPCWPPTLMRMCAHRARWRAGPGADGLRGHGTERALRPAWQAVADGRR